MEVDIGIICALKLETRGLQAACYFKPERLHPWPFLKGRYQDLRIGMIICGIGKVLASAATQWLIDYTKPKIMINWGCAGGVDPQIKPGAIVASKSAVEYDYGSHSTRRISADNRLFKLACAISGIKPGILATADQNLDSLKKRRRLWREYQALACDWESAAILRVAATNRIPALALRVISDMGDCRPGADFSSRANPIMAEATPVLLEYMRSLCLL